MVAETFVMIPVPTTIAQQLPPDADDLSELVILGLKSWRVAQALATYQRGRGPLVYAAEQAGVSLREMIALAYAHGLQPKNEPRLGDSPLSLEQASTL